MFDQTKSSVQNFVRETASTEDGVKYSLKTTYQHLPDATLVWRTGRIEPPLNAFVGEFDGNVDEVPLLDILVLFLFRTNKVSTIIRPNNGWCTPTGDKPLHSYYTRTGVHGRNDFNVNGASSKAREEETQPILGIPTYSNVKRAEVVDPGVRERRRLVCKSFFWEVSHGWLDSGSSELSARDAVGFNGTQ